MYMSSNLNGKHAAVPVACDGEGHQMMDECENPNPMNNMHSKYTIQKKSVMSTTVG